MEKNVSKLKHLIKNNNRYKYTNRYKNLRQRKKSAIILHKNKMTHHKIIFPDLVCDEASDNGDEDFRNNFSKKFISSTNLIKKKMNVLSIFKTKLSDGSIDKNKELIKNSSCSDVSIKSSHSLSYFSTMQGFFAKNKLNNQVHASLQSISESHTNKLKSCRNNAKHNDSNIIATDKANSLTHDNGKKNILQKQERIESCEEDFLEESDNDSTTSIESMTISSSEALPENISDSYKISSGENTETLVKTVLSQSSSDDVSNKLSLPRSGLFKNHSVSVADIMLLSTKTDADTIPMGPSKKIPRLSLNESSIKYGISFSVPNSPDLDMNSIKHEPKFQRLLHRVGLSLHTAPISNKNFDFSQRRQSSKHHQEYLNVNKSRSCNVRQSFQFGLSNGKKTEFKHDGLIGTAMQTILIDKINIMGDILDDNFLKNDINDKSMNRKPNKEFQCYDRQVQRETVLGTPFMSIADLTKANWNSQSRTHASMQCFIEEPKSELSVRPHVKRQRSFSLFDAAIETILIDKVNAIMLTPHSTPPPERNVSLVHDDLLKSLPKALQKCNLSQSSSSSSSIIYKEEKIDSHVISDDVESFLFDTNKSLHDTPMFSASCSDRMGTSPVQKQQATHHQRTESVGNKASQSPVKHSHGLNINSSHRRSSDSDLSITPKANSVERTQGCGRPHNTTALLRPSMHQDNIDLLEYPFLTLTKYPTGFIQHLGGTVTARSVKLLERVPNPDEPETRDTWWTELRMEIRSHARALACNVVLGYSESTTISDDICVLSATGTAAVINFNYNSAPAVDISLEAVNHSKAQNFANQNSHSAMTDLMTTSLDRIRFDKDGKTVKNSEQKENTPKSNHSHALEHHSHSLPEETSPKILNPLYTTMPSACSICHIPYTKASVPFRVKMIKCAVCRSGKVPNVLFCTIEVPDMLQVTGRGCLVQAHVMKPKRDLRSELNAREISDSLPFLEYELHRLLISKLKVKGMNAIFGLKAVVAIGERMIAAIATGTAVFLTALPPPSIPTVISGNSLKDLPRLAELQRAMQDTLDTNRDVYQLNPVDGSDNNKTNPSDTEDSDDDLADLDLGAGNKDACIIEVDDTEDLEMLSLLMEPRPPDGFHVVNTQAVPGLQGLEIIKNLQTFVQVWRAKLPHNQATSTFPKHFQRLLQSVYFKLRSMIPCAVCDLRFRLDLPESDELQLLVTGMALGLGEPTKYSTANKKFLTHSLSKDVVQRDNDLIFSLEEEHVVDASDEAQASSPLQEKLNNLALLRNKSSGLSISRHLPLRERYGVDITPLSYVPGGRIDRYLGNLNFFFIRESTSIRENGGISGFVHGFITEILAVVRAHATALGGNAMVAYYMTELILVDNLHKNQGQCIVSVGGDVVFVSYFTDD